MITETGKVVALKGDKVWVQTIRTSACQSCAARSGCGQRVLASATGGRANQVRVANHLDARVGDQVVLAIEETALLRASFLVYAIPLALMVVGALAGHHGSGGLDVFAMAGAMAGLGGGFAVARRLQGRSGDYEPRMVRIVPGEALNLSTNPTVF